MLIFRDRPGSGFECYDLGVQRVISESQAESTLNRPKLPMRTKKTIIPMGLEFFSTLIASLSSSHAVSIAQHVPKVYAETQVPFDGDPS